MGYSIILTLFYKMNTLQCFPWYVICEAARLALFSARLALFLLTKKKKKITNTIKRAPHMFLTASCENITKN